MTVAEARPEDELMVSLMVRLVIVIRLSLH